MLRCGVLMRSALSFVLVTQATLLGACSHIPYLNRVPVQTGAFSIQAASNANDNGPTTVDAVMIHDDKVLASVAKLTAAQWFATRDQLKNDFASAIEVQEWEIVPGEQVTVNRLPFQSKKGVGLILFANYPGPGEHRLRLDTFNRPRVLLQERTMTIAK